MKASLAPKHATSKIYDSVHGFIRLNELERELIDSAPFQRLHYLHQLGIAYLVYPGATHTRFEHSLGVLELATRIFERITTKETFTFPDEDLDYWRQIIRLAALCHDLGHLPFSHVAEKVLLGKEGHENWTLQIIQSSELAPVFAKLKQLYPHREVESDIAKMAIGEEKLSSISKSFHFTAWEKVLAQIITGDFFGADRIDYLLRDAQCTGVSYGLFDYDQMIEMLCILPSQEKETLELGIEENGIESCEALLLARHFMHKRVYRYSTVKAYSFHLARFMQALSTQERWIDDLESYLFFTENEVLTRVRLAARDERLPGHADAHSLMQRSQRFKAIQLAENVTEEDLIAIKKEVNIPDQMIAWEFSKKKSRPYGLTFSVLTEAGAIRPANAFSKIVIPLDSANWLFVHPIYAEKTREGLFAIMSACLKKF